MNFTRDERGGVSVEFVLLLPLMLAIIILIGVTSHLYAVSSDLQQATFELARRALPLATPGRSTAAVCSDLMGRYTTRDVADFGVLLAADKVLSFNCDSSGGNLLRVVVSYDVSDPLTRLGSLVGLTFTSLTRQTVIGI